MDLKVKAIDDNYNYRLKYYLLIIHYFIYFNINTGYLIFRDNN